MNALERFEIEEFEQLEHEKEQFKVKDIDQANWCLRKISVLKRQEAEITELRDKEIQRIENWHKKEIEKIENSIKFFEGLLEEYARAGRETNPKFKLSTPYGKVAFRKQQPKWNYDEEKLLNFLKESGKTEFIRVKEEVNKTEIKKKCKVVDNIVIDEATGEIIEGITIEQQEDKFIVEVE